MSKTVQRMFDRIATRYDRTNTVLSFGQHYRWRRQLVKFAAPPQGGAVLDVATGTGDLAFLFQKQVGPEARVVGIDFSEAMIELARAKARTRRGNVEFQVADALRLPFPDRSFDVASIAFGIRNVDDPARCLEEMARAVRPGGRVAVLEFGQPEGWFSLPYSLYSRYVIPFVGGAMTGDRSAYTYLQRTSAKFPSGNKFAQLMEDTRRFADVRVRRLSQGIVFAYVGTVAPANWARTSER